MEYIITLIFGAIILRLGKWLIKGEWLKYVLANNANLLKEINVLV